MYHDGFFIVGAFTKAQGQIAHGLRHRLDVNWLIVRELVVLSFDARVINHCAGVWC